MEVSGQFHALAALPPGKEPLFFYFKFGGDGLNRTRLVYYPSIQKVLGSFPTVTTNMKYRPKWKTVRMTTSHVRPEVQPTHKLCFKYVSCSRHLQHCVHIMNQPLSKTLREQQQKARLHIQICVEDLHNKFRSANTECSGTPKAGQKSWKRLFSPSVLQVLYFYVTRPN